MVSGQHFFLLIRIFFRYGEEYAAEDIRKYLKKVKNAQEAHEAIRPTSIRRLPCNELPCVFVDLLHFLNYSC
jgi:DNA topoisomerase IA